MRYQNNLLNQALIRLIAYQIYSILLLCAYKLSTFLIFLLVYRVLCFFFLKDAFLYKKWEAAWDWVKTGDRWLTVDRKLVNIVGPELGKTLSNIAMPKLTIMFQKSVATKYRLSVAIKYWPKVKTNHLPKLAIENKQKQVKKQ